MRNQPGSGNRMGWRRSGDKAFLNLSWWRHQMDTFSASLAICAGNSPVAGEFPTQRPVTRSFDVFFDLRPNKRLSKQSLSWSFETPSWSLWRHCTIQIKICAEYRDMLPRPRLVCQEPGLRPIGRSPGVPDKSSRGLGSMSRYSAQILICFIAYIFSIFNFSVGLVGNLAELPLFIVIRMRLLSAHQTIKSPSMPCWGAAGRNTLWHSCHRTGEISR